ncbi:MAG: hypothetical protein FD161_1173 [Limisphaerales bacterium]|nr:MAG: hypothetical protein FD161_1173 [Limisphaerales bacterium]KAG0509732.1 MAG: hypothetical protein E1N63_1173 [Limisphaerales bacterium]TXT47586.1 MAG: hypothetical protein FD140_4173 [Limisphaerales bacterium]
MPIQQKSQKSEKPAITFETGQIWEMAASNLRIGLIGKTLVHYKHYRGTSPRASVSLANKGELAQFLIKNKAVLAPPVAK